MRKKLRLRKAKAKSRERNDFKPRNQKKRELTRVKKKSLKAHSDEKKVK